MICRTNLRVEPDSSDLSHIAVGLSASDPAARRPYLARADTKHNSRVVQITSRCPVFSFHPRFTAREKIPLKFHVLSDTVYRIRSERLLENGAHPVNFGQSALSGFEFQIASSGAYRD